jgi:hypothetical protein
LNSVYSHDLLYHRYRYYPKKLFILFKFIYFIISDFIIIVIKKNPFLIYLLNFLNYSYYFLEKRFLLFFNLPDFHRFYNNYLAKNYSKYYLFVLLNYPFLPLFKKALILFYLIFLHKNSHLNINS